jgi:LytS/YehU family sensor histidine kinase
VVFFLNYTLAAFIINYFLLPRYFYLKKYLLFTVFALVLIIGVILVEELVIERIFFPDGRGKQFHGVIYPFVDILPILVILTGFKFAWDAIQKQQEVDQLKATVEQSELQFLKSQINPHFLFNNLNNLYSYAIENSPQTPSIILELSSVLRYMLYECQEKFVMLSKEVEQLENFTRLNQLQIEDRGVVTFKTRNIRPDYQIAPLILIVFIENAFKHSQACQSDNITIEIMIELSDRGWLDFYCRNSYQSGSNTNDLSYGIGLENVKKRLELLYPQTHTLNITETDHIFEVHLSMHLILANKA